MRSMEDFNRHNKEINENLTYWQNKPILQTIYNDFYALIGAQVDRSQEGLIVELGSGIGNLKQHIPECICTDVFPNPWIDQVENAYRMTFPDNHFDYIIGSSVLHHLDIPKALSEMFRVLKPGGRIAFTEPNMMNPQIAVQKNVPYVKRKLGDSPDETAFFRWRLRKLLRSYGFVDIAIRPFDFLHPATPVKMIPLISGIGLSIEKCPIIKEISGSLFIKASKQ